MEGPSLIQSNSISEWVHYNAQFQHQTVICLGCMKVSALENVPVNTKKIHWRKNGITASFMVPYTIFDCTVLPLLKV